MVMILHACAASNNYSTILWDITIVTHASLRREWLIVVIHVYNSMIVSKQQVIRIELMIFEADSF